MSTYYFILFKHQRQRAQATFMPVKSSAIMHVKQLTAWIRLREGSKKDDNNDKQSRVHVHWITVRETDLSLERIGPATLSRSLPSRRLINRLFISVAPQVPGQRLWTHTYTQNRTRPFAATNRSITAAWSASRLQLQWFVAGTGFHDSLSGSKYG